MESHSLRTSLVTEQATRWWEDGGGFFGRLYIEADDSIEGFQSVSRSLGARTRIEAAGAAELCRLAPGDRLLDCPCGYGRHSLALAGMGFQVVGVDVNEEMLAVGRAALEEAVQPNCVFQHSDMRDLPFQDEFDAVVNMFYSFGFFESEEENSRALDGFRRALRPGGRFLMHTFVTPERYRRGDIVTAATRELRSGRQLQLWRRFDEATGREEGQWTIAAPDGSVDALVPYSMRLYSGEEWLALCNQAGFDEVRLYGDWDGNEYHADRSELLIVVAVR